jgi:allantoicase
VTTAPATPSDHGPDGEGEPAATDVDLAARSLGGSVVAASDEAFGDKENLLRPEPPAFEPGHYGNRGEIVDGWETRRRRSPGQDWAIVRLGAAGSISVIDVDTSFFTGNHPVTCRVEATGRQGYPSPAELDTAATSWVEVVPRSQLRGDSHNAFQVADPHRFTHVRLWIDPDGGVARLRVLGRIIPDPRLLDDLTVDLATQALGGRVAASSDGFYAAATSLIRPDEARTMGEGWETRRRRDGGHDSVVISLGLPGRVTQVVVDTTHFKYNASEFVALFAATTRSDEAPPAFDAPAWKPLLARTRLQPDTRHVFDVREVGEALGPLSAIRLDAFPDGGLTRLRVLGNVSREGRIAAGLRWFNALTDAEAREVLLASAGGMPEALAAAVTGARPLGGDWREGLEAVLGAPNGGSDTSRAALGASAAALAALLEGRQG